MEQHFTIALWMFVLVGRLHAAPLTTPAPIDSKQMLLDELCRLSCNETATFRSPTDMTGCYAARLEMFITGMGHAKDSCKDDDDRIDQAVEVMNDSLISIPSENCDFNNMTDHDTFASFVGAMKTFIEKFNSQCC